MSASTKHFTQKSFTFFTINYVIGVGFLTTIGTLVQFSLWGYLIILLSAFVIFAVSLVFSRLADNFKENYGGSYAFVRHLDNDNKTDRQRKIFNNFSFFVGWNQFVQNPILSSVSPLFLASAIIGLFPQDTPNYLTYVWITRILSLLFFIFLIFLSTIGLKTNKKIILVTSTVKWFALLMGIGILVYSVITDNRFDENFTEFARNGSKNVNAQLILSNALLFVYAFAGTEDVSAMVKDVEVKSFRRILIISFAAVLTFYMVAFTLLLGFDAIKTKQGMIGIYSVFLIFGSILFIIGYLANDVTSKITASVSTARKLVPICEDGNLFYQLTKKNKKGEFQNAIWFTTVITLITLVVFWVMNIFLGSTAEGEQDRFFETAILGSAVALVIEDFCTFITAFLLERKKVIKPIPIWEKIIYVLAMILILVLMISYFFPQIYGVAPNSNTVVVISIYFAFIVFGIILNVISKKISPKWYNLKQKKNKKLEK
ncbi:amino acid permease [Mycoplasma hafezii]|uniref:amino acid permease n=1 Tax=Mycoplasma hafezii TaxID=525886 RepID=UPI003CE6A29C